MPEDFKPRWICKDPEKPEYYLVAHNKNNKIKVYLAVREGDHMICLEQKCSVSAKVS